MSRSSGWLSYRRTQRPFAKWLAACLLLIAAGAIPGLPSTDKALSASLPPYPEMTVLHLKVTRYKSRTFTLPSRFATAVVGSPDIADVLPMSDRVIYVQGKRIGTTNVSLFSADKHLLGVIDVEVTIDTKAIADRIHANIESPGIRVSANEGQIILSGEVRNAVEAEQAVEIAKGAAKAATKGTADGSAEGAKGPADAASPETPVINLLRVAPSQQVLLKVRFLEATRNAVRDLGVNFYSANSKGTSGINTGQSQATQSVAPGLPLLSTIGTFAGNSSTLQPYGVAIATLGGNVDLLVSALEVKGLVRELAEPDLVALSGDTASFLAGGQVPIPVVQPSSGATPTITVDYKTFGVQLTFQPTVLANGVINLRLTPSVSELDYSDAIQTQGFLIPGITIREARTTVELRDGQSFAIAGLLQSQGLRNINQVPWLGSVPVLGALFRSSNYQQQETDLVVIVTPHLVAPVVPGQKLASPLDSRLPSNDADLFLMGETEVPKQYKDYVTSGGGIAGPYGHIMPLEGK